MSMEQLRHKLQQQDTAEASYKTGVSISTIDAIKSGRNKNPTTKIVNKINAFLERKENESSSCSEKSSA